MSDYDNDRPSKRRRREASSSPSNARDERVRKHDYRERSPYEKESKRRRSRDREARPNRKREDRSASFDDDRRDQHRRERKHYSRSEDRDRDTDAGSSKHRYHSYSPREGSHRHKERRNREHTKSRSYRDQDRRSRSRSRSPRPHARSKAPLPSQNDAFTATSNPSSALDKPIEKQKPNFGLTGKLATASNTIQTANQTIVLKYHEPAEARKPPARDQWRMYVFKGEDIVDTVELSEQSCWLIGREVAVADLPIEHPSCSKQHAVIQFRHLEKRNEFGDKIGKVKPYVLDLESANGTSLNGDPVPAAKYVELRDKDVLRFGQSSREYVIQLPPAK